MAVLVMRRQRVGSAGWEAALFMISDIESDEHTSTGRSGSKKLRDLKPDDTSVLLVTAVDERNETCGLIWASATMERGADRSNRDLAPFVIQLHRVYVNPLYRGRRPISVMQMLWDYLLATIEEEHSIQPVSRVVLESVSCVLAASMKWAHLFQQTAARNPTVWCFKELANLYFKATQKIPELERVVQPCNGMTMQKWQEDVAKVHEMLTGSTDLHVRKGYCTKENILLSLDVMTGRHCMVLPDLPSLKGAVLHGSPSIGLYTFRIQEHECPEMQQLENILLSGYHSKAPSKGLLAVSGLPNVIADGYNTYDNTWAPVHDAAGQRHRTAVITRNHIEQVLASTPSLAAILDIVLKQLGLDASSRRRVETIHLLAQDDTALADFRLHVDNTEIGATTIGMLTAIVQLSKRPTFMRMLGCMPCKYSGKGSATIFPGGAIHESCYQTDKEAQSGDSADIKLEVVFKVVFFLT